MDLFAGGVGGTGDVRVCVRAALYARRCGAWALFAGGAGGDAFYATLYAGGRGG